MDCGDLLPQVSRFQPNHFLFAHQDPAGKTFHGTNSHWSLGPQKLIDGQLQSMFRKSPKLIWTLLFVGQVSMLGVNGLGVWASKSMAPIRVSSWSHCAFHYCLSLDIGPSLSWWWWGTIYWYMNANSDSPSAELNQTIFINRIKPRGILGRIETSNEPGFVKRMYHKVKGSPGWESRRVGLLLAYSCFSSRHYALLLGTNSYTRLVILYSTLNKSCIALYIGARLLT